MNKIGRKIAGKGKAAAKQSQEKATAVFYDTEQTISEKVVKAEEKVEDAKAETQQVADRVKSDIEKGEETIGALDEAAKRSTLEFINDAKQNAEEIEQKTQEVSEKVVDVSKEAKDKAGGFFSKLGKKIIVKVKDVKHFAKETEEKAAAVFYDQVKALFEKIKEVAVEFKNAAEAVEVGAAKLLGDIKDEVEEANSSSTHLIEDAKEGVHEIKDNADVISSFLAEEVKDSQRQATTTLLDINDTSADAAKEGSEIIEGNKNLEHTVKEAEGLKDTVEVEAKKVKDEAKRSSGFLGKIGKKITGKVDDAKEVAA